MSKRRNKIRSVVTEKIIHRGRNDFFDTMYTYADTEMLDDRIFKKYYLIQNLKVIIT